MVRSLINNEIHLSYDDQGPFLKAITARTIRNFENSSLSRRAGGLIARLPNYEDVVMKERSLKENYDRECFEPTPLEPQLTDLLDGQINDETSSGIIEM